MELRLTISHSAFGSYIKDPDSQVITVDESQPAMTSQVIEALQAWSLYPGDTIKIERVPAS